MLVNVGDGKEQYVLKLVLQSCQNVSSLLLDAPVELLTSNDGFHCYFTMFDNPITTKVNILYVI